MITTAQMRSIGIVESGCPIRIPIYCQFEADIRHGEPIDDESPLLLNEVSADIQRFCSLILQIVDYPKFQRYEREKNDELETFTISLDVMLEKISNCYE